MTIDSISVFTKQEIGYINSYCINNFKIIEDTSKNIKRMDADPGHNLFWDVIYQKIKHLLDEEFVVKGGFHNKTSSPYLIHSDGRRVKEVMYRSVLIPLELDFYNKSLYTQDKNYLILFNQTADYASIFCNGRCDTPSPPYSRVITDEEEYEQSMNGFTGLNYNDDQVIEDCSHLYPSEFFGLSTQTKIDWTVGSAIIFHPHIIHTSTNFKNIGVETKTNLVYSLMKV